VKNAESPALEAADAAIRASAMMVRTSSPTISAHAAWRLGADRASCWSAKQEACRLVDLSGL